MRRKWLAVCAVVIVMLVVLLATSFRQSLPTVGTLSPETKSLEQRGQHVETNQMLSQLLTQRNSISRLLNKKQQKLGQLECEKLETGLKTSSTGGWCQRKTMLKADTGFVTALAEFLRGKYVASFGDGPGRYKQLMLDSGKIKGYDAYDGAPFCEDTSEGRVQFLDLTLPQYGLPMYDWVLSLEVAEHIPKMFESIFIDNVVRHAREGVVLSWARLGQGGYAHVNNQPFEYVKQIMEDKGFVHDKTESNKLQSAASFRFLKWNTNVYRRMDLHSKEEHAYNA